MVLNEVIEQMKNMGELLLPYNFPQATTQNEDIINPLKIMETTVDGYNIFIHYSKAFYGDHYIITVQVFNKLGVFLPFNLVVKIGRKFLGTEHLSIVEILKNGRKIYCWTLCLDKDKKPMAYPNQELLEHCTYEGFEYDYMKPNQVNFY